MDLITKRIPASKVKLPDWAYDAIEKHGIEDAQLIRKGLIPEDVQFEEGERSSVDYITTKTMDRDKEIVLPKGAILSDYKKHPVVLFGHDYKSLPIGKSLWIKRDEKGLVAKTQYASHAKADEVYQYRKEGFPMAKSIGFVPLETVEAKNFGDLDLKELGLRLEEIEGAKRIYPKWLMLEYSDVPVPSNPDALQLAISKGFCTEDEVEKMDEEDAFVLEIMEEKTELKKRKAVEGAESIEDENELDVEEETEELKTGEEIEIEKPYPNEHACRLKDPDAFQDGSFRRMTRDSDGKEYSVIMGKLKDETKMTEQAYRYAKDVWDAGSAGTHCKGHAGTFEAASAEASVELEPIDKQEMLDKRYEVGEEKEGKKIEKIVIEDKEGAEKVERWNLSLSKAFDVAEVDMSPSTPEYDIISRYLDCKVKEIYQNIFDIPSAMIGNYLSAFKDVFKDFELEDVRNFTFHGTESPPIYETIQLNSKESNDFLIIGLSFYKTPDDVPIVVKTSPTWGGMAIVISTTLSQRELNKGFIESATKWVDENNFLKGERFALSGEFIFKTEDGWDNIFLTLENELAVSRSVDLINKKGKDLPNRGILLIGPPGTGKTLSGRVVMNSIEETTFIWISSRDFYRSSAAGGMSFAFRLARQLAPTVLFVEDIDNWLSATTIDLLKTEMDGLRKSKGVVTILTSNYPERLPNALIDRPGRFHDVLNFDLPNSQIRQKMFNSWASEITDKMLTSAVRVTEGFSGAHIFELISFAKSLMEEEEIGFDEALKRSWKKMAEQRELINQLKPNKEGKDFVIEIENESEDLFEVDEDIEEDFTVGLVNKASDSLLSKGIMNFIDDGVEDEIKEKAGRVLSTKNRTIIKDAVDATQKATEALTILLEATNPDKQEPAAVDVTQELDLSDIEVEEKEVEEIEPEIDFVDEKNLKETLTEVLVGLGLKPVRVSVAEIIDEKLKIARGQMY